MKLTWATRFFLSIWRSITDLNFYVEVLNYSLRYSLAVLTGFFLIVGLVMGGIFSVTQLPKLLRASDNIQQQIQSQLPASFTMDWNGTVLTSNPPLNLSATYPEELKSETTPELFLNLDLTGSPTTKNSMVSVYQDNTTFHYIDQTNKTTLSEILGSEKFTLNPEQSASAFAEIFSTAKTSIQSLAWLSVLYFSIGVLIVRLITIALDSIVIQFAFQLMGKPLSYRKVFQLCMHLLIPTEIIWRFQYVFFPQLELPIWSITFWLLAMLLLWHLRNLHIFKIELKDKKKGQP